ncbi:helix-turn-helix transcriptional regulator [Mycoplasmatota bacterium zrk1]
MSIQNLDLLKRIGKSIAATFGINCEVVIHSLEGDLEHTVVFIENGHVSNRSVNDGPSYVVLEAVKEGRKLKDHLNYLTKTEQGKILKCSSIFMYDNEDRVNGVFSINFDITDLNNAKEALEKLLLTTGEDEEIDKIPTNINEVLDALIKQSVKYVGKSVELMNKKEKIEAIRYLHRAGAFLITKSGEKVANYFSISKFSIYNYIE